MWNMKIKIYHHFTITFIFFHANNLLHFSIVSNNTLVLILIIYLLTEDSANFLKRFFNNLIFFNMKMLLNPL